MMIYFISLLVFCICIIIFVPLDALKSMKNMHSLVLFINGSNRKNKARAAGLLNNLFSLGERLFLALHYKLKETTYKKWEQAIMLAGLNERMSVEAFFGVRILSSFVGIFYSFLLYANTKSGFYLLFILIFPVFIYFYIGAYVKGRIKKRQWEIEVELPGVLNSLAVITEAGLGFIESIKKVCEVRKGIFINELKKMLDEINLGILQKDALFRMAARCNVNDVNLFASTLVQSFQKGASGVAAILKEQAHEAWEKRKNKAKDLGEKASIKLFLPMLLLVFPALLIFMLGPAILTAVSLLRGR